jgi:surfeit locus 1 family protein
LCGVTLQNDSGSDVPPRTLAITPAGVIGTLLLLIVVAVCVRLGFWQLTRLEERRARNAHVAARLVSDPVTDIGQLHDTTGLFYRGATLHGVYDGDRSIVLPGRSYRGVPGVHLLTPLLPAGRGEAVLVNRGWVPSADAATIDVTDFATSDTVIVYGLLLPFPGHAESLAQRPARRSPENGFQRVWFTVDAARLRAQFPYPLLPVTVQDLPAEGEGVVGRGQYPARLEPPPLDEGPHLGYALQWFGFALVGVIGWVALVLGGRAPPRTAPLLLAAALGLGASTDGRAQLRPLDPMEWRVFDAGEPRFIAGLGTGVLWRQPASLAGTRGTLLEAGTYGLTLRSGRMAISLGGTAVWRMTNEVQERPPHGPARPADGTPRLDAGRAQAATLFRISPDAWPIDVVIRFGATLPTTSDESGLERDRTDFYALAGLRYRRGRLGLTMENGVGIHGTVLSDYPQSDAWTYSFQGMYNLGRAVAVAGIVGQEDGLRGHVRGNEDLRELRLGLDLGHRHWLQLRYIHGISQHSPANGLRITAGLLLDNRR